MLYPRFNSMQLYTFAAATKSFTLALLFALRMLKRYPFCVIVDCEVIAKNLRCDKCRAIKIADRPR